MVGANKPLHSVYRDKIPVRIIESSLPDFLNDCVSKRRDHVAMTAGERKVTYGELSELVERFAAALDRAGIAKGDRVGLMLPNSIEYVVGFFGAARAGACVTQINPLYMDRELRHILSDSGTRLVVVDASGYDKIKQVQDGTPVTHVVPVGTPVVLQEPDLSFEQFMASGDGPAPAIDIDYRRDLAALQYTGGTTGMSKGAVHTHGTLLATVQATYDLLIEDPADYPENAKAVAIAPFFHIFGMTMVLLASLRHGWNLLIVPRFDPREMMELVKREQPAVFCGVTTIFTALNAQPDLEDYGFDKIRLYPSGGATVPVGLNKAFQRRTGRYITEGYGLSEGAPTNFNTYLRGNVDGSIGVPVPGTEERIVDLETGADVAPGQAGELVIRGPQIMLGYLNMPDETAETLRGGWLHTGDIARMDDDGYVYIVDRKKDMINASGYKIYPREVEEVLYELDAVVEAAVIGVPHEYRGETVKAFLVLRAGAELTAEHVTAHCRQHLAAYKVPRLVEFRDWLPRSGPGKVLKRVLLAEVLATPDA